MLISINSNTKGQLISKYLFVVFNFLQKTNVKKQTCGFIVVKQNSFVRFLEEKSAWKNNFDFVWPLVHCPNSEITSHSAVLQRRPNRTELRSMDCNHHLVFLTLFSNFSRSAVNFFAHTRKILSVSLLSKKIYSWTTEVRK